MSNELKPRYKVGRVLAANLKRLRTETGLSQREFAALCEEKGMSWPAARLSNAETNAVPLNTIHELVTLRELFSHLLSRTVSYDEFFVEGDRPAP